MKDSSQPAIVEQLRVDHRFRLIVSVSALGIAFFLNAVGFIPDLRLVTRIFVLYSIPYLLSWGWLNRRHSGAVTQRYILGLFDFAAITAVVRFTGGPESPFFYLYPVPFLVHALQFDLRLILWDGLWAIACYGLTLSQMRHELTDNRMDMGIGQLAFLGVILLTALWTSKRFQRKDQTVQRSVSALQTMVRFLEESNALPPALSHEELQARILDKLREVLTPFGAYPRLWIANLEWNTLHGIGEHPALRPGAPKHLPMNACPAFALKKPFRYSQTSGKPCPSEQFNYTKHLCLPIVTEHQGFGVLFLGTYGAGNWNAEEIHLFEMLAHAIAFTLQRRTLFEKLEEKIGDLKFSFEVGAASSATFIGSTQSIEETTVHILDSVLSILKVDQASLMLWDPRSKGLQTQWVRGGDFRVQSPMHLHIGEGMAGWALQTGGPYWAEYAMTDPHYQVSAQRICSLLCVPIFTTEGEPLGVINAVTREKPRVFLEREIDFLMRFSRPAALALENARLHQRNRANIDQLSEINKLKSQFLSLVSHDLRGPLTGIQGFCEVLRQEQLGTLTTSQFEVLEQMERQVQLQERMVDDLLDLARMEKGQLSIHPAPTDLAHLLKEEVDKAHRDAKERKVALTLSVDLPSSLSSVPLDGGRIRQVLWNLIHNALKFTPENGRITVRAGIKDDAIFVDVEDTGIGLAQEAQEKIFDKFFQISPGGSTSSQGFGLGLAICKEIVTAHHGAIRAHSRGLGLGTIITFSLPLPVPSDKKHPKTLAA